MSEQEISDFITIIRPQFMTFCKDACRAATLNHMLFRIAWKSKDQQKEKIQAGDVLWYAKNEQITSEMSNAWGVCKVRQEVNKLLEMNLIGKKKNPAWGADRTKHFCFGSEQCEVFLKYCRENNICVVHLDLPAEVKHLIYSSNANDKSIKCCCSQGEANDKSIDCKSYNHQMETMDLSNANDKSIEAIPKNTTKTTDEEHSKEEGTYPAPLSSSQPSDADASTRAQFAFQVQGYERFYYHDYCIHAQDRGINDGMTLVIRNLADVPGDAECSICYKPVHSPHGYDELQEEPYVPDFTAHEKGPSNDRSVNSPDLLPGMDRGNDLHGLPAEPVRVSRSAESVSPATAGSDSAANRLPASATGHAHRVDSRDPQAHPAAPVVELSTSAASSPQARAKVDTRTLTLKAHVNLCFQALDKVRRDAEKDPLAGYVQNKTNENHLRDLICACMNTPNEVTEETIRLAWAEMWNSPASSSGFSWKKPGTLTIKAFCNNYGEYLARARARKRKPSSTGVSGPRTTVSGRQRLDAVPAN